MERSEKPNPKALRAYERLMHHRKVLTKPDTDEEEPFDHDLMELLEEVLRPKDEIPVSIASDMFLMHQRILNGEMDISAARKEELRASLIEARKSSQDISAARKVLTKPDTDEEEPFDHDLMELLEEVHRPKDEIPVGIASDTFLMHQRILNGEMDISAARKEELRASLIEAHKSSQEK